MAIGTAEVIVTVATAVITLIQVIDRVWSAKASREKKIAQTAAQVYLMVEGMAARGKLGPGMTKAATYAAEVRRMLEAMGEAPPTNREWDMLTEYARRRSEAEHLNNGVRKEK